MTHDKGAAAPGSSAPKSAHGPLCAGAMMLLAAAAQPARAMDIKPVFDSSITSLSDAAQIESAFNTAAAVFDSAFANPATVNIDVSWGSIAGEAMPAGDVSTSMDNLSGAYSYANVVSYLTTASKANPSDTVLASAVSHLPKTDPTKLGQFEIPYAEAKALGILPGAFPMMDGYIGFDSKVAYDFNPVGGVVTAGEYDFEGLAEHEIEEVLGRTTGLQSSGVSWATPFDLYRYTASGVSSFTYAAAAYFSINGGATDLGNFNSVGGGDRSDWQTLSTSMDVQDAYVSTGKDLTLTGNDLDGLDALGWGISKVTGSTPLGTVTIFSPPGGASAVPEPATWAMMLAGAALIGASVRRRRWRAVAAV